MKEKIALCFLTYDNLGSTINYGKILLIQNIIFIFIIKINLRDSLNNIVFIIK